MKFLNEIDGASRIKTDSLNQFVTQTEKTKIGQIDNKADKSQVLTNVPSGAKFTDTNTTYTAGAGLTLTGTVFTPTFGTTVGTIAQGNDSRFTNSRTPLAHSHAIGDLPTYPTLTSLGAAPSSHSHTMENITDIGDISSINKNASTANFLRGDGTWATPPNTNTTYTAGNGLSLTGASFAVGTPSTITNTTTNSTTSTSHTHALTVAKGDVGLSNVDNAKQMPVSGGTFTGIAKAQNNTSYTIPQIRNISSGIEAPSGGSNGDIYFKRKS